MQLLSKSWPKCRSCLDYIKNHKLIVGVTFILFAISFYICFYQLGSGFFENWDEGWYAEVVKQMLKNHNPIVLYWNGKVFLDKPPLNFWLDALASIIFGLNEFSIRIVSAISGFIVIGIVTIYSMRKWGIVPAIATFSAIALNNIYIWRTRTGNLDALASLLIVLIFFVMISKHPKRLLILGILFGLTYLQKASLVAYPIAIFALHEIFFQWRYIKRNFIGYIICGALFATIVGIWLYLGDQQIGSQFSEYYLYKADQGVAHIALKYFNTEYLWHLYYALQRRMFYLFAIGVIFLGIGIRKRDNLTLVAFALALVIQLTFTQRNNNWYLVPSMPFWALTVGCGTYGVMKLVKLIIRHKYTNVVIAVILLIPIIYVSYKTFSVNIDAIIKTRASVSEVASARKIKELSNSNDVIMRLDHLYPVTIYYSGLTTQYHTTIDIGLYETIDKSNARWVVGKSSQVKDFLSSYKDKPIKEIVLNDETIVQIK